MRSDLQDAPPMMKSESATSKTESSTLVKKDNSTSPQPLKWIIKNSIDSSNVYAKDGNVGSIETAQKKVVLQPREITQMHSDSGDSPQMVKTESSTPPQLFKKSRKRAQVDVEDGGDGSIGSTSNQLVLYSSGAGSTTQDIIPVDHTENYTKSFQSMIATNPTSRVLPSVGTFTVQCASCFKWRLIPTKEKYEEIREHVLERPFTCERARSWRPDITCDDPADISQDGSRLWAIDKPNIALPPPGWERQLRIRGEGGTKFADVYYVAPSGKRLRSMVEVQKYLLEHPEYIDQGVKLSQFSFQIPRPLQENYVRKRPARVPNPLDGGSGLQRPLEPDEVNPLSWVAPTDDYHQVHPFHESQVYHHRPSPQSPTPPPTSLSPPSKKKSTKPRIHIKHCGGNNSSTVVQSEEQF